MSISPDQPDNSEQIWLPAQPAHNDPFIFGVDLDGVCGDYGEAFRTVVADWRGISLDALPPQSSWDFSEWGLTEADFFELHRIGLEKYHIFRHMKPMEGVAEVLWRLNDAGVWIRIITHRLAANWGHAIAVADTVAWLDDNKIPYRDLCFLGRKPEVEADAYVDDAVHNINALRAIGNDVIIFDQPYNQELDGLRARNWFELEDIVLDLVAQRNGAVQDQLPGIDAGAARLTRQRQNLLNQAEHFGK